MKRQILYILIILCTLSAMASAHSLNKRYNAERPLVVVGDWDKPPYEFLNNKGQPAGTNVDLIQALCDKLDIPCKFILKEWNGALKTFERGDADIILANVRRYTHEPYVSTENIINYNRICAASYHKPVGTVTIEMLLEQGMVLKPGDYTAAYFRDLDTARMRKVEFQSPKVALQGLVDGDYNHFVWGEEPLKWKIKELHLEGITLNDVSLPVSEIHIIGRDKTLIYEFDDLYSRLKQSGEVQRINDRWLHPERIEHTSLPWWVYAIAGALLLAVLLYLFSRIAKTHVGNATRHSTQLNAMMTKALHMGNVHVMVYDIHRDRMVNRYGLPILPEKGVTLAEFTEHIHPDERDEFTRKMQGLLTGREHKFELRKRWRSFGDDGHWLNLEGHAVVELDDSGRPAYVVNAIHDFTHDEKAGQAANELERKYQRLKEIPFVPMSFYDREGNLIDINDAMKKLCGFGISKDNIDVEHYWRSLNILDIAFYRDALKPTDGRAPNPLLLCQHVQLPELGFDGYIELQMVPLYNEQGEVVNFLDVSLDMNEERERSRALVMLDRDIAATAQRIRMQQEWLAYLLEHSDRYLMRSDLASRQIAFFRTPESPEFLHSLHDFCHDYLEEADRDAFNRLLTDCHATAPQHCAIHLQKQLPDIGGKVLAITCLPFTDSHGRVTGHKGISTDITALEHTREQLRKAILTARDSTRLKSGFMASMTHELRTPLNAIVGFTGILEAMDSHEERAELVRIIRNSSDMLQRLINDIIEASSLTDGLTTIVPVDVDFAAAFDDICLTLQQRVQQAGIEFIKDSPCQSLPVTIDIGRVQQLLTNFVTNAVKFTKQGHIRVGYRYQDDGLYLYCEDTGAGIPQDKQDVIFERFVKLNEFSQGTGMGLSICKTIALRCGGRVGVNSEGAGKGSTFWVWLPCGQK